MYMEYVYIYYIILYYKNISIVYIYLQGAFTKCLDNYTYTYIYSRYDDTFYIIYTYILLQHQIRPCIPIFLMLSTHACMFFL